MNYIIITSINPPTHAVRAYAGLKDFRTILVGDIKTPEDWKCENVIFLSVELQKKLPFKIVNKLPYNHYSRKMIGYLFAIKNEAEYLIDTDDDNIPNENWEFPDFDGDYQITKPDLGFINIYRSFSDQFIWPRGLPLNMIKKTNQNIEFFKSGNLKIGIWQGLADQDPDVDAIYRMIFDKDCYFKRRDPVVLARGTISPFNTQNTAIRKELFPLLYLPTHVTFRFTDILRGLIAQPIMWEYGYHLGFISPNVIQKRNPHDYMKDFLSEIPMYEYCEKVMELVSNSISKFESIETNLYNAYKALLKEGIVCEMELKVLETWLLDIKSINVNNDCVN